MQRSPELPAGSVRRLRWLPFEVAAVTLATAVPILWSKDFGAFLFFLFAYLPVVGLVCCGLVVWAIIERKSPQVHSIVISLMVIPALLVGTFWLLPRIKDEIGFFVWSQTHSDVLKSFVGRDAIISDWDSWGMAGSENDSYLVSSSGDNLTKRGPASEFLRRIGSTCEIVASKRLHRGVYIVTTYNCPLR